MQGSWATTRAQNDREGTGCCKFQFLWTNRIHLSPQFLKRKILTRKVNPVIPGAIGLYQWMRSKTAPFLALFKLLTPFLDNAQQMQVLIWIFQILNRMTTTRRRVDMRLTPLKSTLQLVHLTNRKLRPIRALSILQSSLISFSVLTFLIV